jgi:glutamate--cysteine ligase
LSEPAGCPPNRFYAYGVVARLAQLAAAVEVEELEAAPSTPSMGSVTIEVS